MMLKDEKPGEAKPILLAISFSNPNTIYIFTFHSILPNAKMKMSSSNCLLQGIAKHFF